jgi:uncharacterized caspase-like protein/ABC-type transporter MlaC component
MHRTTEALRRTGADVALACAGVFAAARGALFVSVLVLGAWLADAASAEEKRVALIVGNSNYEFGPLKNPVNDAALMADTLRELGFEVILEIDASQIRMKRAIQSFGERLEKTGKDGVGLFYYAGHGIQSRGVNYLIPIGAQIRREADLDLEAVSAGWVLGEMEFARDRLNIVILDACRNNPLARGFRSQSPGLARMDAPTGSLIAYSTAPGATARDGDGLNSPYTAALAEAVRVPGLKVEEVFKRARLSVMKTTREEQVPWESSSLTGDFSFRPQAALAKTAPPPPRPAEAAARSDTLIEVAFWKSIETSENAADFQAYLDRYGREGAFTGLARNRLNALTQQPGAKSAREIKTPLSEEQQLAEALIRAQRMVKELAEDAKQLMGAKEVSFAVRVQKFRGLLGHVVDFKTMANFVLGKHRQALRPEQWEAFFLLYQELFLSGYTFTSANSWVGKFEVKSIRAYGPDILVTIEAQRKTDKPLEFALRVRPKAESFFGFKVVDAMVEGLSLLVTQRDEFKPVLDRESIGGLIKALEDKIGKIEKPVEIPG